MADAGGSGNAGAGASEGGEPVGSGDYVVQPGECIESIAYKHGLFWETIWNDPANAEVKDARKDPNQLIPGDRLTVMEKRRKEVSKEPEQTHKFRRKGVPALLRLQLCDEEGPLANAEYTLTLDGRVTKGTTDGDGKLEHALPPDARRGLIQFWTTNDSGERVPNEIALDFRKLEPIESPRGQLSRLQNLGYHQGELPQNKEDLRRDLASALVLFQEASELETTGNPDEQTLQKLQEAHGG